jgi:sn-glycerol 3-phosphate transport system substrate-binding protein
MKRGLLVGFVFTMMVFGLFAQGGQESQATSSKAGGKLEVTAPVTVRIWHSRGAGANGDMIKSSVDTFNSTIGKEKGITVEEVFQGNYATCLSKTMQAIAAGTNPEMVVLDSSVSTPMMAEQGQLVDLLPYMKKDDMTPDMFLDTFMAYSHYNDGIVALPYVRSGLLFYYNAEMLKEAGLAAPVTIQDMENVAKKLTVKDANGKVERYGLSVHNETWIPINWAYQKGSNYASADGKTPLWLTDGSLLAILKDWSRWTEEGWCAIPNVTDGQTYQRDLFYQKKLAMMFGSTGSMSGILANSKFNVGVCLPPSYSDVKSTFAGGGNIAMLSANTSDNARAAAWEFIKFLMSSDQVATNTIKTGYLPVRKDSVDNKQLQEFWNTVPQAKQAYVYLKDYGQYVPWNTWYSDMDQVILKDISKVIQDRTLSPEDAIKDMQNEAKILGLLK